MNAADPFVVAHAAHESSAVVTEEKPAGAGVSDRNQKIPNVAAEYDVTCTNFFAYVKAQGWRF